MPLIRWLAVTALLLPGLALAATLQVLSSVPPVDFLVHQIGGDLVQSEILIKPGRNPENDEPTPRQMKTASKARLWFRIGLPFEQRWEPVIHGANPNIKEVSLDSIRLSEQSDESAPTSTMDPHVWTDPKKMLAAARKVRDALVHNDPEHSDEYNQNASQLFNKLKKLDDELAKLLSPWRGRSFLVYHPAWGHLAQRYGLKQIAMEHEGKTPGPRHLIELANKAKEQHIHTVFVQKQFDQANAATLAHAIHANVVMLDPLSADYLQNMRATAAALAESFR